VSLERPGPPRRQDPTKEKTMTTTEKAIRSFPGKSNAGLRALLRKCHTREDVERVGRKVALTACGQLALEQLAKSYPRELDFE
jgi:hypothetical protein